MRTINPSSFLSLLKPTAKSSSSAYNTSPSSPTTPISSSSSSSDLQPPSPTSSTGSSSSDYDENDTPPVSPVRATTLVVPVAAAATRPPLRRRFGLTQPTSAPAASAVRRGSNDEANSGDEDEAADGPGGEFVSFLGHAHAHGGGGADKDGRMTSFGSVGSCGGNGAKRGGGGGRSVGGGTNSRRGSFNPPTTTALVLSPSIGTASSCQLSLDFSTLPAFAAPAPHNSPVDTPSSSTGSSSDALGLVWSLHAASITSITIDHFGGLAQAQSHQTSSPGGSRVSTPGLGLPSKIQRKRPSICFSLTFAEDATVMMREASTSSGASTPDRDALFSPLGMGEDVPAAPRLMPSLSQTLMEGLLLLPPSPLDLPSPLQHHQQTAFALPPNPPPTPAYGLPPASPRPPTRELFSPPPELPLTPPLTISKVNSPPAAVGVGAIGGVARRKSSVFKLKTDWPTPPSLMESPRMGWRRDFQAGWGMGGGGGGGGMGPATPASTPTGYRRAEGGGERAETRRIWGEFWGMTGGLDLGDEKPVVAAEGESWDTLNVLTCESESSGY